MDYKKLKIWEKANDFAHEVYKVTLNFPKSEIFGLTSQVRRAALSVPTNIVEGASRKSKKEFLNFLNIAIGSLNEVDYLLQFALEENLVEEEKYKSIKNNIESLSKSVWSFYNCLKGNGE
jgi:four helix bundle protein